MSDHEEVASPPDGEAAAVKAPNGAGGAEVPEEGGEGSLGEDLPDSVEELRRLVEEARAEAAENKDVALRRAAELDNLHRRAERKVAEAHQFALSDFALAVGEVRDLLETALRQSPEAGTEGALREGVGLTLRKLVAVMEARHIFPIAPDVGAAFDSTLHEAIGLAPATAQAPADTVAMVVSVGYMLNGRVIRAAHVMVASGEAAPEAPEAADDGGAAAEEGGK